MKDEGSYTSVERPVIAHPVVTQDHLPCIVIFVAGERPCVETAIHSARQLYPDRQFVFVCEPPHRPWLSPSSNDSVFVVEQPFNPFGLKALDLRKSLQAAPIESCALIVADLGIESFRFRVFALRLRTQRFLLLGGVAPAATKQFGRFSFALLAGVTLVLGQLRKIRRRILVYVSRPAVELREVKDRILRQLQERYDSVSEELSALAEELSTRAEEALKRAVEIQRSRGITHANGKDNIKHKFKSAVASLGIRYLDRQYRRVFEDLFREPWQRWFDSGDVSSGSITMTIDTLGPGGSERQAVVTLLGLASRGYRDLSLLCHYLDKPVDRFFAYLLKDSPVSVAKVPEDFRYADSDEGVEALAAKLKALMENLPAEVNDITWYAREFLARRPRVVHAWLDYPNVTAGLAAAIVGVPRIVLSTRSMAPNNFALFQPYMREAYRRLAAHPNVCLLNNSHAGARAYERWLGLPRGTFKVISNGFDFSALDLAEKIGPAREFKARFGIPQTASVVGSVLRFWEEKRPLLWIDVAQRIAKRRRDVMFLVVGDGALYQEARRRAQACGIGDRIVMPGNEKDAAVAIAAMDVFLLTSRVEGLPNVLIEAQALGVPVVTTDVGGAAETLIPGKTGYAIRSNSADRLAAAVLRILQDRAWREAAGTAAQRFVRERFSMSQMVDRTLDVYFARGEFGGIRARLNAATTTSQRFVTNELDETRPYQNREANTEFLFKEP